LPRYYFGIVLGLRAQTEQCLALESQLDQPNSPQTGSSAADKFFLEAATQFEDTAGRAGRGDLRVYALYNQAQVLAKLNDVGNQEYWDQALRILNRIKPFRFTGLPLGKRILARIYAFFRRLFASHSFFGLMACEVGRGLPRRVPVRRLAPQPAASFFAGPVQPTFLQRPLAMFSQRPLTKVVDVGSSLLSKTR
jgi:hypothetical protein